MIAKWRRRIFWMIIVGFVIAGLVAAFMPRALEVDLVTVERGPLAVTIAEEGKARIRDVYVLSAPVSGRMLRISAEVGDNVVAAETIVAQIEPSDPAFLDVRSEEEARAAIKTAEASVNLARAQLQESESQFKFATLEVARANKLIKTQVISERELDTARLNYDTKRARIATEKARLLTKQHELAQARAHLVSPADPSLGERECDCVTVLAPVSGTILMLLHESERVVEMGTPLVEIGDPTNVEIVVDYLSTDAVQIKPGQAVIFDQWGGDSTLNGIVRKVEPYGFTKTSALGIDEQRVNVIVDISNPHEQWQRLGHGYQINSRVILWASDDALKIPLTALARDGENWIVFTNVDGRAHKQQIDIGRRNDLEAAVLSGLDKGMQIIDHPSKRVRDDILIRQRQN